MEWITAFGLAIAAEERKRKKEQKRQLEQIVEHRSDLSAGISELEIILGDLTTSCAMAIQQIELDNLKEFALLFPMEEVLSLQGYIGEEQRQFLREHLNITKSGYNVGRFARLAIERTEDYAAWRCLAGLEESFCGQIWHTLIELVCRRRAPELMQKVIDAMGRVLYHFWFLENEEMTSAQICYQHIISYLNFHAAEDQKTAYLHAVMLLQVKLAEKYGDSTSDYEPCLDLDETCDMDGQPNLCFTVYGKNKSYFVHFYAVRENYAPGTPDLIWELPAGGGAADVFFADCAEPDAAVCGLV